MADWDLLFKIAYLYYEVGLSQKDIAERLGLSRPTVCRSIQRAREEGIVTITLSYRGNSRADLERKLESFFGLKEARVVVGDLSKEPTCIESLASVAAEVVSRRLTTNCRVGISYGTTVSRVIKYLKPGPPGIEVVQLVGGIPFEDLPIRPEELARAAASALNARYHLLYAPAVVTNETVGNALRQDASIKNSLRLAQSVELALVGIGPLTDSSTLVRFGMVGDRELSELRARGAVGDICFNWVDIHGNVVNTTLDAKYIGVKSDDLRRVPCVICVAGGSEKAEAILGVLRSGLPSILVTDEAAANRVLAMVNDSSDGAM